MAFVRELTEFQSHEQRVFAFIGIVALADTVDLEAGGFVEPLRGGIGLSDLESHTRG